ncbi:hypothetical protein HK096_005408, partial [Nowakowskiella sp. JEL0078]
MQLFTVAILTGDMSDRVSAGAAVDGSGPALEDLLHGVPDSCWRVSDRAVVPDDPIAIQKRVCEWTDRMHNPVNLILTTGGTGFGIRDVTPEAVSVLLDKHSTGLITAMLVESLKITPLAALSRPVAGVRKNTLILTLPGSKKGSVENLAAILGVLPHAVDLARGVKDAGDDFHRDLSNNPADNFTAVTANKQRSDGCSHHHHHHGIHTHQHSLISLNIPVALRPRESQYPIISFNEAFEIVESHALQLNQLIMPVSDSLIGHVLAETIFAKEMVPAFRASIVDGYAVI